MSVTWKYIKPLAANVSVSSFCEQRGLAIPDSLIRFLESHNGGRPSPCAFDTDKAKGYVFNSLFSYNERDAVAMGATYDECFAGTGLYPIGIEAAGNVICHSLGSGKLVLWNHESGDVETIVVASNPELFDGMR